MSEQLAKDYSNNLSILINSLRQDISILLPFLCNRTNVLADGFNYLDEIRTAQETCTEANYEYIDCDDLEMCDDLLHFNTTSIIEMGTRFANTFIKTLASILFHLIVYIS